MRKGQKGQEARRRRVLPRGLLSSALALSLVPVLGVMGAPGAAAQEGSADLRLTKTADPTSTTTGTQVTYTYNVSNRGPSTAKNTVLTDYLQPGVTFASFGPDTSGCEYDSTDRVIRCSFGDMASGATRHPQIRFTYSAPGTFTNTASVASDTPDPRIRNNRDAETVTVGGADLRLDKTAAPSSGTVGTIITYTYNITNNGPSTAANVVLDDTLPEGATFAGFGPGSGACAYIFAPRTLRCGFGDLAPGASATQQFSVTYDTPGTKTNAANTSSDTPDPNTADNRDQASVTIS